MKEASAEPWAPQLQGSGVSRSQQRRGGGGPGRRASAVGGESQESEALESERRRCSQRIAGSPA